MNYLRERIFQELKWLADRIVTERQPVENITYVPCDYKGDGHAAPVDGWRPLRSREELRETVPAGGTKTRYGEYHAWFKADLVIPQSMKGKRV